MIPSAIKIISLLIAANIVSLALMGQPSVWNSQVSQKNQIKKGKLKKLKDQVLHWGLDTNFNHGFDAGLKLNTNGWTGCIDLQKRIKKNKVALWTLAFSEIKDDKQNKQQATANAFPQLGAASAFVFGKINNLYTLQLGYGRQILLLPSVLEDNISISFRYSGGFGLRMLKPYYLKLVYIDQSQPAIPATLKQEKYSTANADKFLNTGYILGAANWTKGLDEMQYIPGGFLEGAIVIQPGKNKSFVQTVTIGGNAAIYAKTLPIMADRPARSWQASFFIGLAFGKRWK